MLKVSAMIINIITLAICIIFTLYNNIASYKNKMRWKYTFFLSNGNEQGKNEKTFESGNITYHRDCMYK